MELIVKLGTHRDPVFWIGETGKNADLSAQVQYCYKNNLITVNKIENLPVMLIFLLGKGKDRHEFKALSL